jgi:hypothetical protein
MQAHITGGVVALWFSVVVGAHVAAAHGAAAQGHEGHAVGKASGEGKAGAESGETREHLRRAKQELEQAGETAAEDTRKALKEARDEAHEKLKEARVAADEAADEARAKARALQQQATAAAREGVDEARQALQRADEAARDLGEQARAAWREAAEKFDGDPNSPEGKRHARRMQERHETWRRLREQMKAKETARPQLDPTLKTELAVHARRHARLTRIRDLALQTKDAKAVAKVDTLLERERVRHERRVEMLTAHAEPDGPEGE